MRTQQEKERYEDRVHAMARAMTAGLLSLDDGGTDWPDEDVLAVNAVNYVDAVDEHLRATDPDMVHVGPPESS